jgi:UDP:flavonoid glycosyltransferase YjiC (YdhE family)
MRQPASVQLAPAVARASSPLRIYLGAFGEPGHAFPMLALGAALAARGHEVSYETWTRWREPVQAAGMDFVPAPEYPVFPTREQRLGPYEAIVPAALYSERELRARRPHVVVHDVLTLAPALAAERLRAGGSGRLRPVASGGAGTSNGRAPAIATLIPHLYPVAAPGMPPFGLGARPPRTRAGGALWRALEPAVERALRLGRAQLNDARARLGLPPTQRLHGGLSPQLCLVGSLPQLEYPRAWPPEAHLVGPLLWDSGQGEVSLPAGEEPLVLIAPSTAQDREQRLLRCALAGLAGERLRVLASTNGRPLPSSFALPANAALVEWIRYSQAMPEAALVICHAGFGTLARALTLGRPVLAVPRAGDMFENAARLAWSGAGLRLPWRLLSPASVRLAVRRALTTPALGARAAAIAAWARAHDPASRACELIEALAGLGELRPPAARA